MDLRHSRQMHMPSQSCCHEVDIRDQMSFSWLSQRGGPKERQMGQCEYGNTLSDAPLRLRPTPPPLGLRTLWL